MGKSVRVRCGGARAIEAMHFVGRHSTGGAVANSLRSYQANLNSSLADVMVNELKGIGQQLR